MAYKRKADKVKLINKVIRDKRIPLRNKEQFKKVYIKRLILK